MNLADMVIHVHPELNSEVRSELARALESRIGVDCAEFSHHTHPHALVVRYDADRLNGREILETVQLTDPDATMAKL